MFQTARTTLGKVFTPHQAFDTSGAIGAFLDAAGERYLEVINDIRPESLVSMIERMEPALRHVRNHSLFVSVGIGQGEEIHALRDLFPHESTRIVGVDISDVAIAKTHRRLANNGVRIELAKANATRMPFENDTVDAIFLSSVLHEVFSYHPDGLGAWKRALGEVARVLAPGGVGFVRDFAAPDLKEDVICIFRTDIARSFYSFFKDRFRSFSSPSWGGLASEFRDSVRMDHHAFPQVPPGEHSVRLPFSVAGEVLLHFRNFWCDLQNGAVSLNSASWKEADEMYYLTSKAFGPPLYAQMIVKAMNKSLAGKRQEVHLISKQLVDKDRTNKFLSSHFVLKLAAGTRHIVSEELIGQVTRKIEMLVSKAAV